MSSVGSAGDRNNATDEIRRSRQESQQRESEAARLHKQEIKRMTESHQQELEELRQSQSDQLVDVKERTKELIDRRDMKFQKDVNDLRDFYKKELIRSAAANEEREKAFYESHDSEVNRLTKRQVDQEASLRDNFDTQILNREATYKQNTEKLREVLQKTLTDDRKKLIDKRESELAIMAKDRDQRIDHLKGEIETVAKSKQDALRQERQASELQKGRLISSQTTVLNEIQADHAQQSKFEHEGFMKGIETNRERFNKADAKRRQEFSDARDVLYDSFSGRTGKQIQSLKSELMETRGNMARERVSNSVQKRREMENLRDALLENVEGYKRERDLAFDSANKHTKEEIDRLNKKSEGVLGRANRFFLDKIAEEDVRNRERFQRKEADFESEKSHFLATAENRIERLKTSEEIQRERMQNYFDNASTALRENFETTLRELRSRNKQEQNVLLGNFAKQTVENDRKFQEKLGDVTSKYEKMLNEMGEKHQKELKEMQTGLERRNRELNKKSNVDLETQNAQWEYRVSKLQESHKKQLDNLNQKHNLELANLTKTQA